MGAAGTPLWLNAALPDLPWDRPLPGIRPQAAGDWLRVSDSFAAQMAEKERLLAKNPGAVLAMEADAAPAARALLQLVLTTLRTMAGYVDRGDAIQRPDGAVVGINPAAPMQTLARLCQEDFCLLQPREPGGAYHLTAAALCFPASWRLADKFGQPLTAIHAPVARYDANIAARVARLFTGVRADQPLERANALLYADPALHQPNPKLADDGPYLRCERQTLRRLPDTDAVVFSIHTYLVLRSDLPVVTATRLAAFLQKETGHEQS